MVAGSAGERRLDVYHRRPIDRFDRTNAQTVLFDPADNYPVKSDWIGPIGRAGGKYAGELPARIRTGSNLAGAAICLMEPRQDQKLIALRDAIECFEREGMNLEPSIGSAFVALLWRFASRLEHRANNAHRAQLRRFGGAFGLFSPLRLSAWQDFRHDFIRTVLQLITIAAKRVLFSECFEF